MVKFQQHAVVNTETGKKARVHYTINNRVDGRKCVTVYAKDYGRQLDGILDYQNGSDMMTDYFEKDRAVLFEDHPLYQDALKTAELVAAKWEAKWQARRAA